MEERKRRRRRKEKVAAAVLGGEGEGLNPFSKKKKKIIGANSVYGMVTGIVTHRS